MRRSPSGVPPRSGRARCRTACRRRGRPPAATSSPSRRRGCPRRRSRCPGTACAASSPGRGGRSRGRSGSRARRAAACARPPRCPPRDAARLAAERLALVHVHAEATLDQLVGGRGPAMPPPRTATRLPRPVLGTRPRTLAHDRVAAIAAAAAPACSTSRLESPPMRIGTLVRLRPCEWDTLLTIQGTALGGAVLFRRLSLLVVAACFFVPATAAAQEEPPGDHSPNMTYVKSMPYEERNGGVRTSEPTTSSRRSVGVVRPGRLMPERHAGRRHREPRGPRSWHLRLWGHAGRCADLQAGRRAPHPSPATRRTPTAMARPPATRTPPRSASTCARRTAAGRAAPSSST